MEYIVDIGSRSVKLYRIREDGLGEELDLVDVFSWNPIERAADAEAVQRYVAGCLKPMTAGKKVVAVGTCSASIRSPL